MDSYGLHWFRRDLRVAGNAGLQWSWKQHSGRVVGVFAFDSKFLGRDDFSLNRFGFFLKTLEALKTELKENGSDLLVLDVGPDEAFEKLFQTLKTEGRPLPETISFCRDYEPFARERDDRLLEFFQEKWKRVVHTERDHLLFEPWEIEKTSGDSDFYQVYTPYFRKWFTALTSDEGELRIQSQKAGLAYLKKRQKGQKQDPIFSLSWRELFGKKSGSGSETPIQDHLERYLKEILPQVKVPLPEAGSLAALERLQEFNKKGLKDYSQKRDFPATLGTSRLSVYLKNGSITVPQVIAELGLKDPVVYLKELAWREFYYSILYHRPEVADTAFLPKYRKLSWTGKPEWLEAWKNGMTGYPIIDAGMRELKETGWMHNRVRMIVASFLVKDLLVSWQEGERFFMKELLDGDLAPNNGGWQWAASTGCDPQPYFRIFNPVLQSQRFDPQGDYIRRYVPELRELSAKEIHEPWKSDKKLTYPEPIVEHKKQKDKAIKMFKAASERAASHE
jgi:deoxyribodipyrimidine photo-lyase